MSGYVTQRKPKPCFVNTTESFVGMFLGQILLRPKRPVNVYGLR